jgi:uncharacterized protein YceK
VLPKPEQYGISKKSGPSHPLDPAYGLYPGTRTDIIFITAVFNERLMNDPQGPLNYFGFVYGILSIPFDFCMDTALLPIDLVFAGGK